MIKTVSVERFVEHIKYELKPLYEMFLKQPTIELTNVMKGEHKAAKNVISVLKSLITLRIES